MSAAARHRCARRTAVFVLAAVLGPLLACSGPARRGKGGVSAAGFDYQARDIKPARMSRDMAARCEELTPAIERAASTHRLDPALIQAIVRVESGFDADARSPVGARGLMQVMPRTGLATKCRDLEDAEDNLDCGARVLRRYVDRFGGDLIYGLAAYNAGPGNVRDEFEARRLPRNFRYVELIFKMRSYFQRHGCRS